MLNLAEAPPYSVEHNGVTYRLTPAFGNVLLMRDIAADDTLLDGEKVDLMLHLLLDGEYPTDPDLLLKICDTLFPAQKQDAGAQKAFDFHQDAELIYSAFLQAYGIDLIQERHRLHWWQFIALLHSLPDTTKFAEVVRIRLMPMPKATPYNQEQLQHIARLKAQYRVQLSETEREQQLQNGLRRVAVALLKQAERGGEK